MLLSFFPFSPQNESKSARSPSRPLPGSGARERRRQRDGTPRGGGRRAAAGQRRSAPLRGHLPPRGPRPGQVPRSARDASPSGRRGPDPSPGGRQRRPAALPPAPPPGFGGAEGGSAGSLTAPRGDCGLRSRAGRPGPRGAAGGGGGLPQGARRGRAGTRFQAACAGGGFRREKQEGLFRVWKYWNSDSSRLSWENVLGLSRGDLRVGGSLLKGWAVTSKTRSLSAEALLAWSALGAASSEATELQEKSFRSPVQSSRNFL